MTFNDNRITYIYKNLPNKDTITSPNFVVEIEKKDQKEKLKKEERVAKQNQEESNTQDPLVSKTLENCGGKPKHCPLTEYLEIKESKGRGKPEYIFRHKKTPTVLLVECKTETANHQSEQLDKPALNNVDGLLYYAKYFKDEFDVLGLAISEEYFPIEAKPNQESLDIEKIRESADKLHDIIYQGLGFTEKEKPFFISACLIALKNEDFRNEFTKKTTPKSLVLACDVVGEFYHEFLKYSTGDGKGLGIVLTPSHIANLFCELALKMLGRERFSEEDKILDICCGTGDGKSHIYRKDCFDKEIVKIIEESNCNIGILNPPYSQKKKKESEGKAEIEFIEHSLNLLKKGGIGIAIVPLSVAIGTKFKEERERIMKRHALEAVMTMPSNLFVGNNSGSHTCVMVWRAKERHNKETRST
ncbi:7573_t:CDS:2 [Ambispora gerdemannii]|uniref:site-specific DNA-methyltransferase (adenine-specific) n=1 Tax=Ambispora gerdemannii TaxID=144530 RepID=A0A9N9CDZ0_9GLOM|nr:7573_t:CDS:2 [Ambispora gerdemannii]